MIRPKRLTEHRQMRLPVALAALLLTSPVAHAAPEIRTSEANRVPACVTPERLMAFLAVHNDKLDPKYREIARWYKYWGEAWHVRWDYAFFQMALETNYLKFRRGDGKRGDVHEKQNNFAGLGATGGGVPGERFKDIKTGVLAQIQHLVAYSGERLAQPVAERTQLKQDDIVSQSQRLRRPVKFSDLARRWAADRAYGRSIDTVAEIFRTNHCVQTAEANLRPVPEPQLAKRPMAKFAPPSKLGGPKPDKLAGPAAPTWLDPDSVAETSQPVASPSSQESAQKSSPAVPVRSKAHAEPGRPIAHNPPVKTIWSREGGMQQRAAPEPDVRPVEPVAATPPAAQSPPTAVTPPLAAEEPVSLPEFKIKPSADAPLHLGGPDTATRPAAITTRVNVINPSQRMGLAGPVPMPAIKPAGKCRVLTASYGGTKTLLVRTVSNGETRLTALTVLDGFEKSMFEIYAKANAPDAELVGEYPSKDEALADARANCQGR
jgi:hypothetical protein